MCALGVLAASFQESLGVPFDDGLGWFCAFWRRDVFVLWFFGVSSFVWGLGGEGGVFSSSSFGGLVGGGWWDWGGWCSAA